MGCAAGTFYGKTGGASSALCNACPEDTYAAAPGTAKCTACAAGKDAGTGATACSSAPAPTPQPTAKISIFLVRIRAKPVCRVRYAEPLRVWPS